jgi:hypothetical protein
MAKANSADRRFAGGRYRSDAHWDFALQLDADDPDAFWSLLDERASWFYEAVGAGAAMAPKRPGPSSAYLSAYKDKAGEWLDGGRSYRLRVPPSPPIKLFWSVTVYDVDTRALILNKQKIADRSSRMDLLKYQATLLLRRLGLDKSHVGSGDGLADRFSIGGIILLSLDVGPDIGRRHQAHPMPKSLQFP